MAISSGAPGFTFNAAAIQANAPAVSGVYALYNDGWVYVGESQDIRNRLLEHLRDARIMSFRPTGFCFELQSAAVRVARQDALIAQLRPAANRT